MSGIEIFGVIAGIVQLADVGTRLSVKLLSFTGKVRDISKEVALTCAALHELSNELHRNDQARLCSDQAVKTADEVVKECEKTFGELQKMLDDNEQTPKNSYWKWTKPFKYPLLEQKVEILRSNLERLKSILLLMLNVIIYARQLKANKELRSLRTQRDLIKRLDEEKKANKVKFTQLTEAIDGLTLKQSTQAQASQSSQTCQSSKSLTSPQVNNSVLSGNQNLDLGSSDVVTAAPRLYPSTSDIEADVSHYCALVCNLIETAESAKHQIEAEMRIRIHGVLLNLHAGEFPRLHGSFTRTGLSLALELLPVVAHLPVRHAWDALDKAEAGVPHHPTNPRPRRASISTGPSEAKNRFGSVLNYDLFDGKPSSYKYSSTPLCTRPPNVAEGPSPYSDPLQAALADNSDQTPAALLLREWIKYEPQPEDESVTSAESQRALKRRRQD